MELKTNQLIMQLDDKTGNIISLKNKKGKENLAYSLPLIRLKLLNEDGTRVTIDSQQAHEICTQNSRCVLTYKKIGGYEVDCTVTIRFDEAFIFELEVENRSGLIFEAACYPNIVLKDDLVGREGKNKLFWSAMEGVEVVDSSVKNKAFPIDPDAYVLRPGWGGKYPGGNPMQFMAYYDEEDGVYIAAHDETGAFKYLDWYTKNDGIVIFHEVYPEKAYDLKFSIEYPFVIKGYKGDSWYEAADIYKSWLHSSCLISSPLYKDNKNYPQWLKENPVVLIYPVRGETDHGEMPLRCFYPYTNGIQYVKKYNEVLGVKALVLLMHWEGTAPWAPPHVWPPFGDYEDFKKFDEQLHESGNRLGLYCSGISWTEKSGIVTSYTTEEYFKENELQKYMELYPDQTLHYSRILGMPYRLGYDMCPSCEWVKKTIVDEVGKICKGSNIDYLQFFDQNLGGSTCQCYSKNHSHQPVPGKWMAKEMRNLIQRCQDEISSICGDKQVLMGCESAAAEPFVNQLLFNDLRYEINFPLGKPVSAYSYMFSKYFVNFMGNQNGASNGFYTKDYADFIFYRYAYSFVQGDILALVLKNDGKINWEWMSAWDENNEPDQDALIAFIKEMCLWKNGGLKNILNVGDMVKPNKIDCDSYKVNINISKIARAYEEIVCAKYDVLGKTYQIFVNFKNENKLCKIEANQLTLLNRDSGKLEETYFAKQGRIDIEIKARGIIVGEIS